MAKDISKVAIDSIIAKNEAIEVFSSFNADAILAIGEMAINLDNNLMVHRCSGCGALNVFDITSGTPTPVKTKDLKGKVK
jgi:hypothetical protein